GPGALGGARTLGGRAGRRRLRSHRHVARDRHGAVLREGRTGMTKKVGVAVVGSGNIGTDLLIKILRGSPHLRVVAMAGIAPASDGLPRARRLGVATTSDGVPGLVAMPEFGEVEIILDATSAAAHVVNARILEPYGRRLVDLTPAAIGPFVVPPV